MLGFLRFRFRNSNTVNNISAWISASVPEKYPDPISDLDISVVGRGCKILFGTPRRYLHVQGKCKLLCNIWIFGRHKKIFNIFIDVSECCLRSFVYQFAPLCNCLEVVKNLRGLRRNAFFHCNFLIFFSVKNFGSDPDSVILDLHRWS